MDLKQLTSDALAIAEAAGAKILTIYDEADFSVESKQDNSPLTAADLASHQYIVRSLEALTPDFPVLSEESAQTAFEDRKQWTTYWLVDPLDGTREFIKRNDEFSVLIALIHEQRAILGVVHAPAIRTSWFGSQGKGAYKKEGDSVTSIQARTAASPFTVVGSRSHAGDSLKAFLEQIGDHELVSMGSILKACMVADGRADIYPRLGPTSEWDTAAAQIIVEEAGGRMLKTDGSPLRYNTKDSLLNPYFLVVGDSSVDWAGYL